MRGVKRLWSRRLTLAVGVLTAAATSMGVSQCGAGSSSTITVSGSALTIYASAPSGTPGAADILDAEKLALTQAGGKAGSFSIRFIELTRSPSDNARTAIQDTSAIAYLGEVPPGGSADTMGITEDQDLLQVSPTDTAIALTRSTPAVPGAPKNLYEQYSTYGKTFARVVPSGRAEARAQLQEMAALHVKRLYVTNDGSDYGKAIAYAIRQDAPGAGLTMASGSPSASAASASGADALFFGASPAAGGRAGSLLAALGGHAKLFVPSALASAPLPQGTYVSQPGFLPKDLPPAGRQFVKAFQAQAGRAPSAQAIFGYEAMSAVLAVLHEAGTKANNRSTVVHDFFKIKNRQSVLGTYSIDADGDPSIAPIVLSRFSSGALIPYKFVQASP